MFNKTCKAIALSCLVVSSSAWAYCEIDESTSTVTDNGECSMNYEIISFGEAAYSGAEKVGITLPAKGSGVAIKPVICEFTENTGDTTTPIQVSNLFPNPQMLTLVANGNEYPSSRVPQSLFAVQAGTQVEIKPAVGNEEATPVLHHVSFNNPHCPQGNGCTWSMYCHVE